LVISDAQCELIDPIVRPKRRPDGPGSSLENTRGVDGKYHVENFLGIAPWWHANPVRVFYEASSDVCKVNFHRKFLEHIFLWTVQPVQPRQGLSASGLPDDRPSECRSSRRRRKGRQAIARAEIVIETTTSLSAPLLVTYKCQ
jgi:hypothetical protein